MFEIHDVAGHDTVESVCDMLLRLPDLEIPVDWRIRFGARAGRRDPRGRG